MSSFDPVDSDTGQPAWLVGIIAVIVAIGFGIYFVEDPLTSAQKKQLRQVTEAQLRLEYRLRADEVRYSFAGSRKHGLIGARIDVCVISGSRYFRAGTTLLGETEPTGTIGAIRRLEPTPFCYHYQKLKE